MATDAVVVQFPGLVLIETVEEVTTLAQFAPLQPGRSYLVWACGSLESSHALVTVELEAFDAKHFIQLGEGARSRSPSARPFQPMTICSRSPRYRRGPALSLGLSRSVFNRFGS